MEYAATNPRLLVVSRDSAVLRTLSSAVESNGWQIDIAGSAWEAIDMVQTGTALDMLLIDVPKGHPDGVEGMRWLRRVRPDVPVMLIDHADDSSLRHKAACMGALGYLAAPFSESELEDTIHRSLSMREAVDIGITSDDIEKIDEERSFVALGPLMRRLRHQVGMLAETDLPVYISGEPGTGKETVARLLHRLSLRSGFAFERVDCAALSEEMLEREIFGYTATSVGASKILKPGKLEKSAKGRLFLREITQMPLRLQSKLAHALQRGAFATRDSSTPTEIDVAIVASSSINADQAVAEHRLDTELCRYLSAYEVRLPPLRERKEEVSSLSHYFMYRISRFYRLEMRGFSSGILETWRNNPWPGNLRELEQMVKRYLIVGDDLLEIEGSSSHGKMEGAPSNGFHESSRRQIELSPSASRNGIAGYKSLRSLLQSVREEAEKSAITMALEKTGWNRKAAARLLKTSYRSVLYKIEQYKLRPSDHFTSSKSTETEAGPLDLGREREEHV
jgi:two-component system response regulator AtoC